MKTGDEEGSRAARGRRRSGPFRGPQMLGSGFELVAAVLGFALVGYWLGGKFGNVLMGTAIGAILGIVGGMYNLLRQALAGYRRAATNRKKSEK